MSKEGTGTIVGMILVAGFVVISAVVMSHWYLTVLAVVCILLTAIVVYFFRDPERTVPQDANLILSPADGKVVEIKDEFEKDFIKSTCTRVSIFLSVFDVHVNRIPVSGKVGYLRYQKGSFVQAYKSRASHVNEQTIIGIEYQKSKIVFKQIAGLLARRIVCDIRDGDNVTAGERFGIIKFGSRVDIFLTDDVELKVSMNQKVKGGESIIGVIR